MESIPLTCHGRRLVRLTITQKIGLLALLPAFGAMLALGVFWPVFARTATDGHFINIVGRQQMLLREIHYYAHTVAVDRNEGDRDLLRQTVATFDQSLGTLERGGPVGGHDLPPAPAEVVDEIAAVKRLWAGIKPSLFMIADRPAADPQVKNAYDHVQSNISPLIEASDRLLAAHEETRQAMRQRVFGTLAAVAGFDLVLLIAGFWLAKHNVARPILLTVQAARRIREGDFSQRVPILTQDELAVLACTFNGMSADIKKLLAEREKTAAQLRYMADHDALTGLFNRRRLLEKLDRELAEARRYGTRGALMFLDLDGFKQVNDTLGHQAGDDLLIRVADLLRAQLRGSDTLARLGGDEFAILLPHTDAEEAEMVAKRILEALGDRRIEVSGQTVDVTASIGVAVLPEHGTTVEHLLAHADRSMYHAKRSGRNNYQVAPTAV